MSNAIDGDTAAQGEETAIVIPRQCLKIVESHNCGTIPYGRAVIQLSRIEDFSARCRWPHALKIIVFHVVFDIIMVHNSDFLGPGSINVSRDTSKNGLDLPISHRANISLVFYSTSWRVRMQTPLFVGVSKVMLSGMITNDRVSSSGLAILSPY